MKIHPWRRLWAREDVAAVARTSGFAYEPYSVGDDKAYIEHLQDKPCLILLGEPGLGKSTACAEMSGSLADQNVLSLNLKSYGSEARLQRDLFESEIFQEWLQGQGLLYVVLDSLDECLLHLGYVADWIGEELQRYLKTVPSALERLRLRIFCRTAIWPRGLENQLRQIWREKDGEPKSQRVWVYELLPLCRQDAVLAAEAASLDAEAFLREVSLKQVEALAAKPVTLRFLLSFFAKQGSLPPTEAEIYAQGCLLLCDGLEDVNARRSSSHARHLQPEQRLAVASRLAALSVFCNADSFSDVPSQMQDGVLSLEQARGGGEKSTSVNGLESDFEVTQQGLEETLETGLFSSHGEGRLGWAHRTYVEFLAAHYLSQKQLAPRQITELYCHSGDPEQKIVPQLHETAARWVSLGLDTSHAFFRLLLEREPEVLLLSDIAALTDADKLLLARALLEHVEFKTLPDLPTRRLHVLRCSGLETLLKEWIEDDTKSPDARQGAIEIAGGCQLAGLCQPCIPLVLDVDSPVQIRQSALHLLIDLASISERQQLRPLLNKQTDDLLEQIRGLAFQAMWPHALTAREIFEILELPTERLGYGNFSYFFSSHLSPHLHAADLPIAIDWIRAHRQTGQRDHPFAFEQFQGQIVEKAWQHLELPHVLSSLSELIFICIKNHQTLTEKPDYWSISRGRLSTEEMFIADAEKRRAVLKTILPRLVALPTQSWRHSLSVPLLTSDDLQWLLQQAGATTNSAEQETWIRLVPCVFSEDTINEILEAGRIYPQLAQLYINFQPVELGSARAGELRELHAQIEQNQTQDVPSPEPTGVPPHERILTLLDESENGDNSAWWKISCCEITLEEGDRYFLFDRQSRTDIRQLPGWKKADEMPRTRLLSAAMGYVQTAQPQPDKWFQSSPLNWRPAFAGYQALRLISHLAPENLPLLTASVWAEWTPVILRVAGVHIRGAKEPGDLLALAYQAAPDALQEWLSKQVDAENEKENRDHYFVSGEIEALWDDRIAQTLLQKAGEGHLRSAVVSGLLESLLKHGTPGARELALNIVFAGKDSTDEDRRLASYITAGHLIIHTHDAAWEELWPHFESDIQWGREVVERVATIGRRDDTLAKNFKPSQIADFYLWLAREYPPDESLDASEWRSTSIEREVNWLRANLSGSLVGLGSFEAYEQLQRLIAAFPDDSDLRYGCYRGAEQARRRTWIAPSPSQVLQLCSNPRSRLVTSEAELLEVVLEILEKLGQELQGNLPLAPSLWNDWPVSNHTGKGKKPKLHRPKDEEHFSRFVARFLDDQLRIKGIVINREVEIRPGEFTDILVQTTPKIKDGLGFDQFSVIIEAKGSWHPKIKTAMKDQLVHGYMRQHQCRHGVYLVGWFQCDKWDSNDNSKDNARAFASTIEDARDLLGQQADALSRPDLSVRSVVLDTRLR